MALFTRAIGLLRQTVNPRVANKAWASQKANTANQGATAMDQAIGLVAFFAVFLVPSGWILAHIKDYRQRPE